MLNPECSSLSSDLICAANIARLSNAGADLDSTGSVKSELRAEVPSPRKKAAKFISANDNLALAA
jgi:hypothetical protein